jgi:hypothetical protein
MKILQASNLISRSKYKLLINEFIVKEDSRRRRGGKLMESSSLSSMTGEKRRAQKAVLNRRKLMEGRSGARKNFA